MRQVEPKQTAWFAVTTAVVAIVVVLCGRATGLGGGQAEPIGLTLSAPQLCEMWPLEEALEGAFDEHGNRVVRRFGWYVPGEMQVAWTVSGGVAPYSLTLDGETWDSAGAFVGRSGTGSVSCALTHGASSWLGAVESGSLFRGETRGRFGAENDSGHGDGCDGSDGAGVGECVRGSLFEGIRKCLGRR